MPFCVQSVLLSAYHSNTSLLSESSSTEAIDSITSVCITLLKATRNHLISQSSPTCGSKSVFCDENGSSRHIISPPRHAPRLISESRWLSGAKGLETREPPAAASRKGPVYTLPTACSGGFLIWRPTTCPTTIHTELLAHRHEKDFELIYRFQRLIQLTKAQLELFRASVNRGGARLSSSPPLIVIEPQTPKHPKTSSLLRLCLLTV